MESFKKILVDIDATASAHPALERAILLAKSSRAMLTVTDVMTVPPYAHQFLPGGIEDSLVRERREQLERVAGTVTEVDVEAKLLVGRPATVLIEEVLRSGHDLVMRSHARQTTPDLRPFGAVDMELLRQCPCPVLLVRQGPPAAKPRIACAVDASADDADAQALNTKIVDLALVMASGLGSDPPALLHAWMPFAERAVRLHATSDQFTGYVAHAQQHAISALRGIVQSFAGRLDEGAIVLRRGAPEDVIPQFVISDGIDLLVMGTVARSGISGMLIGNTAERVLRKLPCSVVTVKPDGFVSPVRLSM